MPLTLTNALTTLELGLQAAIVDALGRPFVLASIAALRANPSRTVRHLQPVWTTGEGKRWRFDRFSTAADDGVTVIAPTDGGHGRYLLASSQTAGGYLRAVELYDGNADPATLLERLNGQKPGVVIVYDGDEWTAPGMIAGSVYRNDYTFDVWCLSSNLRAQHQAATGSAVDPDDPGVNRITGDVAHVIAGSTLGDIEGVRWVEIKSRSRQATSLADRLMIYGLRIVVYASVHNVEDEAPLSLGSLSVQRQLVEQDGTVADFGAPDILPNT